MYTHEYSNLLGKISDNQFQAALDRFDLGEFVHAEPIPFGLSKRNVFLTSTKGEFVFRGSPHTPHQFLCERFFAEKLHAKTRVPIPWPYLIDPADDIFGWSYAIMPCMLGLQLADPEVKKRLGKIDRKGIAHAMGENLAFMQELTWPWSGQYDGVLNTIQPLEVPYSYWVIARIRQNLAYSREYSHCTSLTDIQWVEELIAHGQDALSIPFQPCFIMQDYKESNAVVKYTNGQWHVSGIFDLTHSSFGDGEAELSRSIAIYLDEDVELAYDFLEGYIRNKQLRPGFAERFPIYMLDERLMTWEFHQKIGEINWKREWTFRDWASRYVSFYAFFRERIFSLL